MNILLNHVTQKQFQDLISTNTVLYGYHTLPTEKLLIFTTNNSIIAAALCAQNSTTETTLLNHFPNAQPCTTHHLAQLLNQPNLNLTTTGTDFQNQVWQAITKIPTGTTATYQQLAQQLGKPKAYRAVANALARNNIAYFIPCHRITRANGSLGGYKWGIEIKSLLLDFEKKFNTSAHIECLV